MQNQNKIVTIASCFSIVGVLIIAASLIFGENWFKNLFGRSIFEKDMVPIDGGYDIYADVHWWRYEDNNQAVDHQPNVIYCLEDVKIANPQAKTLFITKLSSTIANATSEVNLETQNGFSSLFKEPLPEFSCVETSLLTTKPEVRGIPVPEIPTAVLVTVTPGASGDIPIFDFELEGEFAEDKPAAVDQCSADPGVYYDRVRLVSTPSQETITISKDQPAYQLYILTTFYVKPNAYQYFRTPNTGATPVKIRHSLFDLNGNNVVLEQYDCFYSISK